MGETEFQPIHIHATKEDFLGNGDFGRIVFLPGSDGRAKDMSIKWKDLEIKRHPRLFHLYTGKLEVRGEEIDAAAISTGIGAPSADIIINELKQLGAKNFIRIGTAGSLQPHEVRCGTLVVPTGAVRDESTTSRYLPIEVPAVPTLEFLMAAKEAAKALKDEVDVCFGVVHSKDSLYAREFLCGPRKEENARYMEVLQNAGVVASEMEASLLFSLGMVFNAEKGCQRKDDYITGAVLVVIGDDQPFADASSVEGAEIRGIRFCEEVARALLLAAIK